MVPEIVGDFGRGITQADGLAQAVIGRRGRQGGARRFGPAFVRNPGFVDVQAISIIGRAHPESVRGPTGFRVGRKPDPVQGSPMDVPVETKINQNPVPEYARLPRPTKDVRCQHNLDVPMPRNQASDGLLQRRTKEHQDPVPGNRNLDAPIHPSPARG
jgi:hypothetical protein